MSALQTTRRFLIAVVALLPVGSAVGADLEDPYFGEALFHAYQERYFEALERLDTEIAQHYGVDEPELDSLHPYIDHAEFSVGDFELYYRMHDRAGRAIRAILGGNVEEPVRNKAAFRLAKIHFQKDQPRDALRALDAIGGQVPDEIRDDADFLRANIYLATGRPSDAVDVLRGLQNSEDLKGFSRYNFGIALLQDGQQEEAIREVDVGAKEISVVSDFIGDLTADSIESAQGVAGLVFLEVNLRQPKRRFIANGFFDVAAENGPDRTPRSVVHPIVEFEVANRELSVIDIGLEGVQLGLVHPVMLTDLGVQALQCFEVAPLIRVKERLSEVGVFEIRAHSRTNGQENRHGDQETPRCLQREQDLPASELDEGLT